MSPDLRQPVQQTQVPVFLVGSRNLAFEGLRMLLLKNGIGVANAVATVHDLDLGSWPATARLLVIIDIVDVGGGAVADLEALRRRVPQACIIALLDQFQKSVALLPALGVNAILDRNIACEALMKALQVALAGYGVLSPGAWTRDAVAPAGAGAQTPPALSGREAEIIGCIAEGHSNKMIARRFSISEATVKIHVRGILRKVDARNRTQAAIWALQKGLGSPAASAAE